VDHCHCKNIVSNADGKIDWSPAGKGVIDLAAQFGALKQLGYHDAVGMETRFSRPNPVGLMEK
jgi:sugar phosphate isomerase/epimerase